MGGNKGTGDGTADKPLAAANYIVMVGPPGLVANRGGTTGWVLAPAPPAATLAAVKLPAKPAMSMIAAIGGGKTGDVFTKDADGGGGNGVWKFGSAKMGIKMGKNVYDLNNGYMERSPQGPTVTQYHAFGYWIWWRPTKGGWRTLFRGNADHTGIVFSGKTEIGFYSNRNGGFRGTGYNIGGHLDGWQLVITSGAGTSATSTAGVTTFMIGGSGHAMKIVGTADRVASGTKMYRLGWGGQGPGSIAEAYYWNRAVTLTEATAWWDSSKCIYATDAQKTAWTCA